MPEAIVIGGGPAGSTAGALLAEKGRDVLILEKEKFPRYHIGESLMPYCYFTLDRLGVIDKLMASACPRKYCVQFVRENGSLSQPFYFFQHMDHPASTTWQVVRSEFDEMLLENAKTKGAKVMEQTRAKSLIKDGSGRVIGVEAQDDKGKIHRIEAPITLDCTGRDAFSCTREKWRTKDPKLNKVAIWTYFRGAKRDPGADEGATTVAYIPEKGWFWYIPLQDNIVSVGIVAVKEYLYQESRDPVEIFAREIKKNAWIEDHLSQGEQFGQYWATGEFSYRSEYCATDGLVLVGDAFSFLDPVFSSGVYLALRSGELAAETINQIFKDDGKFTAENFVDYGKDFRNAVETMRKIVYAFYDEKFSFGKLIRKDMNLREPLTDCLIGNIDDKDFSNLFTAMSEFADLPDPVNYGDVLRTA
ncbi:MAG: FAD-dependent oxidoreductase [Opitutae bacterium]|jgi:flavin-dependent dehydrogenase|nr:FAD-dependent oxidoreductase [Opitutae bacterium]MBT6463779.1 FAD-dependent oxidoreductase [Opitutae bacterium]